MTTRWAHPTLTPAPPSSNPPFNSPLLVYCLPLVAHIICGHPILRHFSCFGNACIHCTVLHFLYCRYLFVILMHTFCTFSFCTPYVLHLDCHMTVEYDGVFRVLQPFQQLLWVSPHGVFPNQLVFPKDFNLPQCYFHRWNPRFLRLRLERWVLLDEKLKTWRRRRRRKACRSSKLGQAGQMYQLQKWLWVNINQPANRG